MSRWRLLSAAKTLVRPGEPLELKAEITNVGDVASPAMHVQWLVGDKVVQESAVAALEPHAKTQAIDFAEPGRSRRFLPSDAELITPTNCRSIRRTGSSPKSPMSCRYYLSARKASRVHRSSSSELVAAALGFKGDRGGSVACTCFDQK